MTPLLNWTALFWIIYRNPLTAMSVSFTSEPRERGTKPKDDEGRESKTSPQKADMWARQPSPNIHIHSKEEALEERLSEATARRTLTKKVHDNETLSPQISCNRDNTAFWLIIQVGPCSKFVSDGAGVSYAVANVRDDSCRDPVTRRIRNWKKTKKTRPTM